MRCLIQSSESRYLTSTLFAHQRNTEDENEDNVEDGDEEGDEETDV
jgi:hypothetical protein